MSLLSKKELDYLASVDKISGEMVGDPLNHVIKALKRGKPVWKLDRGYGTLTPLSGYGEHTYLIGSYDEALNRVKSFYDIRGLPMRWELTRIYNI